MVISTGVSSVVLLASGARRWAVYGPSGSSPWENWIAGHVCSCTHHIEAPLPVVVAVTLFTSRQITAERGVEVLTDTANLREGRYTTKNLAATAGQ